MYIKHTKEKLPTALENIAKRIIDKECSLFIGAGMSLNSNLPSWHQLLRPCADTLGIQQDDFSHMNLFSLAFKTLERNESKN